MSAERLRAIEEVDAERLALERSGMAPHVAAKLSEPVYTVRNRYRFWESLIRRMEDGWAPDGYYVIEEYINDLITRDGIDRVPAERAELRSGVLVRLVERLDARFEAQTVADGGEELRPYARDLREGRPCTPRWYRRPLLLPWRGPRP